MGIIHWKMNAIKRNNVIVSGKGTKAIIFAHGYGCDQTMWRFLTPFFDENYKVVTFDHVGNGKSDISSYNKNKYRTLNGYATDIIEIMDSLGIDGAIFVGHSVSASIGVLVANQRPDLFSELVLIGPSPRYLNDTGYNGGFEEEDISGLLALLETNYLGWSAALSSLVVGNPARVDVMEEINATFCAMHPEIAKEFAKVTFYSDNRGDYNKVAIKTLVLQSTADIISPEVVGRYVHHTIQNSYFHLLKAIGHCPHLTEPQETAEAILSFLTCTAKISYASSQH